MKTITTHQRRKCGIYSHSHVREMEHLPDFRLDLSQAESFMISLTDALPKHERSFKERSEKGHGSSKSLIFHGIFDGRITKTEHVCKDASLKKIINLNTDGQCHARKKFFLVYYTGQ